jgi:hypothetical protein
MQIVLLHSKFGILKHSSSQLADMYLTRLQLTRRSVPDFKEPLISEITASRHEIQFRGGQRGPLRFGLIVDVLSELRSTCQAAPISTDTVDSSVPQDDPRHDHDHILALAVIPWHLEAATCIIFPDIFHVDEVTEASFRPSCNFMSVLEIHVTLQSECYLHLIAGRAI